MNKNDKVSIDFPWGLVALTSFAVGLVACDRMMTPHTSPLWTDIMFGAGATFFISFFVWYAKLEEETDDELKRESKTGKRSPWWYGAL